MDQILKPLLAAPSVQLTNCPASPIHASVYIICQDEEDNIARVLNSVREFDEVILVDSGSSDRTLEIARTYPNVHIIKQDWLGYARQKQFAKSLCKYEWVLSLDSDQEASPALRQLITDVLRDDKGYDGFDIPIVDNDFLHKKNHSLTRFNTSVRFYKKAKGHYTDVLVHESVQVDGNIKRVKAPIYHYGNENLEEIVDKINRYSSLRVIDKMKKGKTPSLLKLIFVFPYAFVKSYLLKRNFLNGISGFVGSTCQAFYAFLKEAKLFHAVHEQDEMPSS